MVAVSPSVVSLLILILKDIYGTTADRLSAITTLNQLWYHSRPSVHHNNQPTVSLQTAVTVPTAYLQIICPLAARAVPQTFFEIRATSVKVLFL
jgi:hypothetical protein